MDVILSEFAMKKGLKIEANGVSGASSVLERNKFPKVDRKGNGIANVLRIPGTTKRGKELIATRQRLLRSFCSSPLLACWIYVLAAIS